MTPGVAKSRAELPWLYYPRNDRVIINQHNFTPIAAWTPASLSTALWLDGADGTTMFDATSGGSLVAANGTVARWEDKSGNTRHVTQSTAGTRPTLRAAAINSKSAIEFGVSSVERILSNTVFSFPRPFSLFVVLQQTGGSSYRRAIQLGNADTTGFIGSLSNNFATFFGNGSGSWQDVTANSPSFAVTSPCVVGVTNNGNSSGSAIPYTNGTEQTAKHGGSFTATGISIGSFAGQNQPWIGYICEIVLTASITSTTDRQLIEGYLAHKWGTTAGLPSGHPYKSVAP